jgi:hypothetical protein
VLPRSCAGMKTTILQNLRLLSCSLVLATSPAAFAAIHNVTSSPYNANGSDMTDDTTAIQDAIDDAAATNGTVYIPAGTYRISSTLTNTSYQNGFTIKGDGASSILLLTSTGTHLLDLTFSSHINTLTIRDLKLRVGANGVANAALKVVFPNPQGSPPAPGVGHAEMNLVAENVAIDVTGSGVWSYGIHITHAWNTNVSNCTLTNVGNSDYQGTALYIAAQSVNSYLVGNTIATWSVGVESGSSTQEGLVIDGGTIGPVNMGVVESGGGAYGLQYLSLQNVLLDCRQSAASCVWLASPGNGTSFSLIRNNTFKVAEDIPNQNPGLPRYHFAGSAQCVIMTHNTFYGNNSAGGVAVLAQPLNSVWPAVISRNTFSNIANGATLWLQTNANNSTVVANGFGGGWFYDQGTSTNAAANF